MKSKTKIEEQLKKKTNSELVETIIIAKKNPAWMEVAAILSGPRRNNVNANLDKISKDSKAGETIVVPGKVLSLGEIDKKIKVVALGFSDKAKEKLKKAGCETILLNDEITKNKDAKGVKILK
ncbi:MAG: 50S ribosomal protein L18e [Nanoarchaeota archaeon]|nr:50S ribosomal protein L18e [Nanoarchaeota archaeon]